MNTSYVKIFILFVGGSQGVPELPEKIFNYIQKLIKKIFIGASTKKYWIMSQFFRYGLPEDFWVNGENANRPRRTDRLPLWFLVLHFAAKNN